MQFLPHEDGLIMDVLQYRLKEAISKCLGRKNVLLTAQFEQKLPMADTVMCFLMTAA